MIRNAIISDLEQIVYIVEGSKLDMHSYGNFQWDEDYPRKEDFINDIKEETLFVYDMDGIIAGLICINKEEPEEYKDVNWTTERDALTIHRLAVNNSFQGKGIGVKLINYVDDICAKNDINYIRTDTNSLNKKAQGLLTKCGYGFKGKIKLLGHEGIFYCYDKVL